MASPHPLPDGTTRRRRGRFAPAFSEARAKLAKGLFEPMRQRARERRTARNLRQLSDATLKDLGIHRSEILSIELGQSDRRRSRRVAGRSDAPRHSGAHARETPGTGRVLRVLGVALIWLALLLFAYGAVLTAGRTNPGAAHGAIERSWQAAR